MAMSAVRPMRVQLATFNANQRIDARDVSGLTEWLVPTVREDLQSGFATDASGHARVSAHTAGPREAPDLYVVGFQEFAPLHATLAGTAGDVLSALDMEIRRTVRTHQAAVRPDHMYDPIELGGGPENYARLAQVCHGGTAMFVYARERAARGSSAPSAAERVKEVRTASVGTGIANVLGNKGAVGVRVAMAGTDGARDEVLTFVCAHLAAHDHNVPRRNADWKSIVERLVFAPWAAAPLPSLQVRGGASHAESLGRVQSVPNTARPPAGALDGRSYSLYDTQHLFVVGDLNYRMAVGAPGAAGPGATAPPLTKKAVQELVAAPSARRWAALAPYDQLQIIQAQSPRPAFQGLEVPDMAQLDIPPTYKYKPSASGAPSPLSAKRLPGWPDRILWGSSAPAATCELYRSVLRMTISDHKPVTCILRVPPRPEAPFLVSPWPVDARWHSLFVVGRVFDRIVGYVWSALLLFGNGSLPVAVAELVVLAAFAAWWLQHGELPSWR
ncbi:hypothetical protein MSPP1_000388 [Malassezia sp. CBS 17886]|nr:hypothetical protein MSPP1_000388 [Malassezia sp. CBS 17886]